MAWPDFLRYLVTLWYFGMFDKFLGFFDVFGSSETRKTWKKSKISAQLGKFHDFRHYGVVQNLKNLIFEFDTCLGLKIHREQDRTKKKEDLEPQKCWKTYFLEVHYLIFSSFCLKFWIFAYILKIDVYFGWVGGCQNFRNLNKTEKSS